MTPVHSERSGAESKGQRFARALSGPVSLGLVLLVGACDSLDPMQKQPRYEPYRESHFWADGRMMRTPPEDTVPQEKLRPPAPERTGREGGAYVDVLPVPLTRELLERGRARYETSCAACHGLVGDGQTPVAKSMALRAPPAIASGPKFIELRVANDLPPDGGSPAHRSQCDLPHPLGYYFGVISEGYGLMPSYADMLNIDDRWAVVAYLRALARSQRVEVARLPPDERQRLEGGAR
jgi:mono/diheme cytochrome c family protein